MHKVTIVIPCYNEALRLRPGDFLKATSADLWLHLLFVDDGSTDSTASVLRRVCQENPEQISWLPLERNLGKAEAVRQGLLSAASSDAEIVGFWDADLSAPLTEVGRMVTELRSRGAAMVIGSRVKLMGRRIVRKPMRHYLGRIFATFASLALDLPVYDTQCGAKLFRNDPILNEVLSRPFVSRWAFDVEIIGRYRLYALAHPTKLDIERAVIEHPLEIWTFSEGSRLTPADFVRAAADLARIAAILRR